MARSDPRPPCGLPEVLVAVRSSRLRCRNAGKAPIFALLPGASGESPFKCPQYEREGIAHVSEDKNPFRNSDFLVDNVAEGFAVRKFAPSAIATEFECVICKCKVLVK
jgi:hypothetical protein